jgi:predicted glycosyltransferase
MKRVLFYCQHVLGMGHLVRSIEIVRGLYDFEVCFLNGGEVLSGIDVPSNVRLVNLPVLNSDEEFREIRAGTGEDLEAVKNRRASMLLDLVADVRPDIAVIELFPFGRRKFAFELIPMLDEIRSRQPAAKIACSLRDIVVSKRDRERYEGKVRAILDKYFDLVLVHSDPAFQRLEESFLTANQIRCPIQYTGFVVRQPDDCAASTKSRAGNARIVASIGGGRVGSELLEAVMAASAQLQASIPHELEIFTGPFLPEERFAQLRAIAGDRDAISLARFTPSLPLRLRQADLSVSMAGYNTCMDVVVAGVPALLYPFTGGENEEQTTRARKLQALGAATVLESEDLDAGRLAQKISSGLSHKAPKIALDVDGVRKTAALVRDLAGVQ